MAMVQTMLGLITVLLAALLGYVVGISRGLGRLEGRMEEGFSGLREEIRALERRIERLEGILIEASRRGAPTPEG